MVYLKNTHLKCTLWWVLNNTFTNHHPNHLEHSLLQKCYLCGPFYLIPPVPTSETTGPFSVPIDRIYLDYRKSHISCLASFILSQSNVFKIHLYCMYLAFHWWVMAHALIVCYRFNQFIQMIFGLSFSLCISWSKLLWTSVYRSLHGMNSSFLSKHMRRLMVCDS